MSLPKRRAVPFTRRRFAVGLGVLASIPAAFLQMANAQAKDAYTFMVLGLDTREENTDQRSDIIMLSRVDLAANTVRTLSIPRDLYVEIPGHGYDKINAAYQIGLTKSDDLDWQVAAALTVGTIAVNFGVRVDDTALTDMNRFPAVVDAVGGVEVDNPYDLGEPDAATNLMYPEGPLHLNGDEATMYCRLRHQDGDGARVMRQHLVLRALLARLHEPEIWAKLLLLIASLDQAVRTNIPLVVKSRLIAMLPGLTPESLAFTNIESQLWAGTAPNGGWIYQGDWNTLPGYVQAWLAGEID